MRKMIVLGVSAFALAGCIDPNASTGAAPAGQTSTAASGGSANCELKNPEGTGTCEDGREGGAASARPRTEAREADLYDCDVNAMRSGENDKFLALYHSGDERAAFAFCASVTRDDKGAAPPAEESPSAPVSPPASSTGNEVPQDGTWYCDNLSGSGQYGTWEMTQHPEMFDVASCYRVDG